MLWITAKWRHVSNTADRIALLRSKSDFTRPILVKRSHTAACSLYTAMTQYLSTTSSVEHYLFSTFFLLFPPPLFAHLLQPSFLALQFCLSVRHFDCQCGLYLHQDCWAFRWQLRTTNNGYLSDRIRPKSPKVLKSSFASAASLVLNSDT